MGVGGDGNYNVGRYSNPQMDGLVERIKVETDTKHRNGLIERALLLSHQTWPTAAQPGDPLGDEENIDVVHRADNRVDWRLVKVN